MSFRSTHGIQTARGVPEGNIFMKWCCVMIEPLAHGAQEIRRPYLQSFFGPARIDLNF